MVEICVIVFPAKSICHSYTSAEARGAKARIYKGRIDRDSYYTRPVNLHPLFLKIGHPAF